MDRWRGLVTLLMTLAVSAVSPAATFDEQRAAVAASVETQPEPAVLSLLEAGIAECRPAQAAALASGWLRQNLPENPLFFYRAGRNNELAGDLRAAVGLYQQFLEKCDPKSAEAGEAITAVHTLLVQELNDPEAAMTFGLNQGTRLAVNPRFRQWDRWFLDTAQARQDREAVATRLLVTLKAGVAEDRLIAHYERDFRWLERSIREVRYDQKNDRFSPEFVALVKELAKAIRFDNERALSLDWAVSVKAYNMARIDGKDASPPVAEAKVLLDRYPRHAERVQTDWAGGHNGPHYRDDPKKYWPHEIEGKLAPVRAAMAKLSPLEEADLMRTWGAGYYGGGPLLFSAEEARAWVLQNPKLANRKSGPAFGLDWNKLSLEDAKKLAPNLTQNPSPEASLVHAIVAAGEDKNLDKALDALLGPEAWRLGPSELEGRYADQLWHWAGRPDGNAKRDQGVNRSKELLAQIRNEELKKEAPANQRLGEFRRLWNDFRSDLPKIPAVGSRLQQVLAMTSEAVPELLRDESVEAQQLLREVFAKGFIPTLSGDESVRGLSPDLYDPLFFRLLARHRNNVEFLNKQGLYRPNALEPELRKAVAERLQKNQLESWLVLAWVNAQFPEDNADQVKLAEQIVKSPAWKDLTPEARFGLRAWFKQVAMTPGQLAQLQAADAKLACKPLFDLAEDPDAASAGKALRSSLDALWKSPLRIDFPEGALEKLDTHSPIRR